MLKSLELENFKAFGERVHIPFGRITLIFGENSAGKSSILQALSLLKHNILESESLWLRTRNLRLIDSFSAFRFGLNNPKDDLNFGSMHELLFDHHPTRTLAANLEVAKPEEDSDLPWLNDAALKWHI